MMGIMMENGEVINWARLCASLCQPRLPETCDEKWWAPAVHRSQPLRPKLQAWETVPQRKMMRARGRWKSTRGGERGSSDRRTTFPASLPPSSGNPEQALRALWSSPVMSCQSYPEVWANWIRTQSQKWVCWGRAEKQISPSVSFFKNRETFKTCNSFFFQLICKWPERY